MVKATATKSMRVLQVPSIHGRATDHADWVELLCCLNDDGTVSQEDLAHALRKEGTKRGNSDDTARDAAIAAFEEISDRIKSCGKRTDGSTRYPFELDQTGALLKLDRAKLWNKPLQALYAYLLTITVWPMDSDLRVLKNIDPTSLFEASFACVLANYWGQTVSFSSTSVFGTSKRSDEQKSFEDNINTLCKKTNEGTGLQKGARKPGAGDGKLDIYAWKSFEDGRVGTLLAYAQCKTGVHWRAKLTELQPGSFNQKYLQSVPIVEPVRMFAVPCRVEDDEWRESVIDGGIMFDRCRIIQYGDPLDALHLKNMRTWTEEAWAQKDKIMAEKAKKRKARRS